RTYVVNGQNAYLLVFTVTNPTTHVFPRLDVSFIADFDIPPGSWDTQTEFDSSRSAILLEDVVDWVEPEQHYWFGIAPAAASITTAPGSFAFSQYNLDTGMSLALSYSRTLDRIRWYLGDPTLAGDHDD